MVIAALEITRGSPVFTWVTVTNSGGADSLRIASMSTWASMASRSGFKPRGLPWYGDNAPVVRSHVPIDSRHLRSTGDQNPRPISAAEGHAIWRQNELSASRAWLGEPRASAPATIAALMAPALAPESCATVTLRLARRVSSTPQV